MSNAERDVKATKEDIEQLSKMGATATAFSNCTSQCNTESGLYKSFGTLLSKLDIFVEIVDDISKVSSAWGYNFTTLIEILF